MVARIYHELTAAGEQIIMKWNLRCLLFVVTGMLMIIGVLQLLEVTNQFSNLKERRELSVKEHAENIMMKTCKESFPVPEGVRIFSDGREVHHFAFLKVHKAASGTATSIFFRFGMTRGLTFLLPKWLNLASSSESLKESQIYPKLNKSFDIITCHSIFNKTQYEKFIHKDSVYIGIVREPYLQFKSSMNYMAPQYVYNISIDHPIQQYLKNPLKYETAKSPRLSWINNRQAAEFGTPDLIIMNQNQSAMLEYLQELDRTFHLVIISEYFDESIVLLRRVLNWKLPDILYRRLHIRGWDRKITLPRTNDRRLYRRYAFADYAIYDHFYKRLWKQISLAGEDFFAEVIYFKQIRDEVDDYCKVYPNMTEAYTIEKSDWNERFSVDKGFCAMILAEEEDWVKQIARKQYNVKTK